MWLLDRITFGSLGSLVFLFALGAGCLLRPAAAADLANAVILEADLAPGFQSGLQLEQAGIPIKLASSRMRMELSDPRNKNQLLAILNDAGFDAPDADEAGNDQSDFSLETILTLNAAGEEVSDTASCNWTTAEKLEAECNVYDGGGGFLVRVESRGKELRDIKWTIVIGEGLSVGYRAASTAAADGKRVEYILRITGRQPVKIPLVLR